MSTASETTAPTDADTPADGPPPLPQSQPPTDLPPPPPPDIPFRCYRCAMHQLCNYHGETPPFAPVVRLPAAFYVKKNPFAPPPSAERPSAEYYLLLGADCWLCGQQVCRAAACSVFYGRTACLACAHSTLTQYPAEMRARINRAVCESNAAAQ